MNFKKLSRAARAVALLALVITASGFRGSHRKEPQQQPRQEVYQVVPGPVCFIVINANGEVVER